MVLVGITKHFIVGKRGDEYILVAKTEVGQSLVGHCKYHGENLVYPTRDGAFEAAKQMDIAIENRHGKPWERMRIEGRS